MRFGAHIGDASSSLRQVYIISQILFPFRIYWERVEINNAGGVLRQKFSQLWKGKLLLKKGEKKLKMFHTQLNLYLKVRVGVLFKTQNSKREQLC